MIATAASGGFVATAADAQPPTGPLEQQCFEAVQGKVAWNQSGDMAWNDVNVRNLCRGTPDPATTISCFEAQIRVHGSWERAIDACQPSLRANGRTATLVDFGHGTQRLGDYRQIGPREWAETRADGSVAFRFDEAQRDDGSVYLGDPARGVKIQLDLHARKVMYSDASSQQRQEMYDILAASAPVVGAAATPLPARSAAPAPAGAAGGGGPIDPAAVVIRCGPVTSADDAAAKCAAVCRHYGGFSGNWAVTAQPNLAACQCVAQPPEGLAANEILSDLIASKEDAPRLCAAACAWYGGGNGTWGSFNDQSSICGCNRRVGP